MMLGSTSTSYCTSPMWCFRISIRPLTSGRPTTTEGISLDVKVRRLGELTVSVESSWPGQSLVKRLWEVGRGNDDDTLSLLESIELDEELVQGLLHVMLRPMSDHAPTVRTSPT